MNSTCHEYDDVPLSALVNHLLFDTTERKLRIDETVTLVGRGAKHLLVNRGKRVVVAIKVELGQGRLRRGKTAGGRFQIEAEENAPAKVLQQRHK